MSTMNDHHFYFLACDRQKTWQNEAARERLIQAARRDQPGLFLLLRSALSIIGSLHLSVRIERKNIWESQQAEQD